MTPITPDILNAFDPNAGVRFGAPGDAARGSQDFALAMLESAGERNRKVDEEEQLREAAQQLVAQTLFVPLLKQARQSPFRVERFHGQGEDAMAGQLDSAIAERLATRTDYPLIDAIVDRMANAGRKVDARA
jgi:hypothetical protein